MRSKEKNVEYVQRWHIRHRKEWNINQRRFSLIRRRRIRAEIIQLLGGQCMNIYGLHDKPFTDVRCLQIDHVHGNGCKAKGSKSAETYMKRILNEIKTGSKDYQLLCANCNWIKRSENHET
jgi:hypothetical protein